MAMSVPPRYDWRITRASSPLSPPMIAGSIAASCARRLATSSSQMRLRDRLGAALNSGRALFLYGPAGTGKTLIANRLQRAAPSAVS